MTDEKNRIDLARMCPTARIAWMKREHEGIPGGKQVLIRALPNAKEPIFEVECEGRIRNIPIDCFSWMSLSYEISELFPNWRPSRDF